MVTLVKNMSLDEGLNGKIEKSAADGNQNQVAVPRNQTVRPIYEKNPAENEYRQTLSLPVENRQNSSRKDVTAESGEARSKRSRNLNLKGWTYKHNILQESGSLISKYATIDEPVFSTRNVVAVQEEMDQFNYLIKMLLSAHEEYNAIL